MELIIDNREKIKNNFSQKIEKKLINLELGDYIIKYKENDILIIERKTISDYCASIKDGRHREQKSRLISKYKPNQIIYLVEGDLQFKNDKYNRITSDTIVSSIINTMCRDNIHVFHTKNSDETIFFIESICKKIKKQGTKFLENKTYHSDNLFNNLTKTCKNSNIDKELCSKLMLSNIPSISIKTAERILMNFGSIKDIINTLSAMKEEERVSYVQNLPSNDEKFRKIPKNAAKNLIEYLI